MARRPDPQFLRRQVSRRLRQLRDESGLTQQEAAGQIDWSLSKLIRIENAKVSITPIDLRALLDVYGVQDRVETEELAERARDSRKQPWHSEYATVLNASFRRLLAYESYASSIHHVHPSLIPGLLQTKAYTREVLSWSYPSDQLDMALDARMARQRHLMDSPPELEFLVDEAVIRREVGGSTVMREQLDHLLDSARRPMTSIRVIPYGVGMYPGLTQPYLILQLADDLGTGYSHAVFLENVHTDELVDDDAVKIDDYRRKWDYARDHALSVTDSIELIKDQIGQLR